MSWVFQATVVRGDDNHKPLDIFSYLLGINRRQFRKNIIFSYNSYSKVQLADLERVALLQHRVLTGNTTSLN